MRKCDECKNKKCCGQINSCLSQELYIGQTTSDYPVYLISADEIIPHEKFDYRYMIALSGDFIISGVITKPIIVDFKTRTLLDGHHRFAALSKYLSAPLVPCVLVDYVEDDKISVSGWRVNEKISKTDVIKAARTKELMPIKTSKHGFEQEIGSFELKIKSLYEADTLAMLAA